jgi:DNA helicase II / ATP-dependent DNA helicase PcrA
MSFICDLHLHSKYSRATSRNMDLENSSRFAETKGIQVLATGDFTHPEWFRNLKEKLEPAEFGLYKLKNNGTRFLLGTEISCIYKKKGKVRKVHILVFVPSLEIAEKINAYLDLRGNLKSDGRPILGLDAKELVKIVLSISEDCLVVPAHVWTPWFGIFGSKSGFDSIEECFENFSKYIYAVETGLSSDPFMNWRLSGLDNIALISNSDAHSPAKIGREANVFETDFSYSGIMEAIKTKNPEKFLYTVEFYPQEGKYYYDGHRSCGVFSSPFESRKSNNICPVCRKPLTLGVLNRVEQLADREEGFRPRKAIPFKSLIPLKEIIAESLGTGSQTKKADNEYESLTDKLGAEFKILTEVPLKELESTTIPEIAEGIMRVREGKVKIDPGYDGVFGKVRIFSEENPKSYSNQKTLF